MRIAQASKTSPNTQPHICSGAILAALDVDFGRRKGVTLVRLRLMTAHPCRFDLDAAGLTGCTNPVSDVVLGMTAERVKSPTLTSLALHRMLKPWAEGGKIFAS